MRLASSHLKVRKGRPILGTLCGKSLVVWEVFSTKIDVDFDLVVCKNSSTQDTAMVFGHIGEASFIVNCFIHPNDQAIGIRLLATIDHRSAFYPVEPERKTIPRYRQSNIVTKPNPKSATE